MRKILNKSSMKIYIYILLTIIIFLCFYYSNIGSWYNVDVSLDTFFSNNFNNSLNVFDSTIRYKIYDVKIPVKFYEWNSFKNPRTILFLYFSKERRSTIPTYMIHVRLHRTTMNDDS